MTERCWIGSVSVSVSASVSASASVRWRLDGRMAFVPEGQADRSLARSAWSTPPHTGRPVGYGVIRAGVRADSMIGVRYFKYED